MEFQTGDVVSKVLNSPYELIDRATFNFRWLHASVVVVGKQYEQYALKPSKTNTYIIDIGRFIIPIEGYLLGCWKRSSITAMKIIRQTKDTKVDHSKVIKLFKDKFQWTDPPSTGTVAVCGIQSYLGLIGKTDNITHSTCGSIAAEYLQVMGLVHRKVNPMDILPFHFKDLNFGQTVNYIVENIFDKGNDTYSNILLSPLISWGLTKPVVCRNRNIDMLTKEMVDDFTQREILLYSGVPEKLQVYVLENKKRS